MLTPTMEVPSYELAALPWREIESSNLRRVAWVRDERYSGGAGVLWVEFHGDPPRVYRYGDVLPATHEALLEAPSAGSFFARAVKGAGCPCERVEPAGAPIERADRVGEGKYDVPIRFSEEILAGLVSVEGQALGHLGVRVEGASEGEAPQCQFTARLRAGEDGGNHLSFEITAGPWGE